MESYHITVKPKLTNLVIITRVTEDIREMEP